jgi:hypothetical protein
MSASRGKLAAKVTTKLGPATPVAALWTAAVTRTIVVVSIMLATLSALTIGARAEGSWCAKYTTAGTNCGFHSFEQCQATVSGVGGFCVGTARESRRQRRYN